MSERVLSLEEIKQVELDILKYLHELCEQHQIKYFIDLKRFLLYNVIKVLIIYYYFVF